jgi:hypothetical protein
MGVFESYSIDNISKSGNIKYCGTVSVQYSVKGFNIKKYKVDFNLSDVIKKVDNSKTPNDFGFHKKSFSIVFHEDELKKIQDKNIEKEIFEINKNNFFSELKKEKAETIDLFVISEEDKKKAKEKESIDAEIKRFSELGNEANKGSDAEGHENKSKGRVNGNNNRNGEYFGGKILAASSEYSRHSDAYRMFMDAYLYNPGQEEKSPSEMLEWNNGKKDRSIPSDEIISYKEKAEYIQAIMMNALMHAPMNHADPRTKDRYEAWKLSSKFYEQLSFLYCDNVLSPN